MTVDSAVLSTSAPTPGSNERRLLSGAVVGLTLVAVPSALVAHLTAGWAAVLSVLLGLGFVLLLFGGSALLLLRAAKQRTSGILLLSVGAAVRIPLYLVSLLLLSRVTWIDARALALATLVGIAVTLAVELRVLARSPQMFWIDPQAPAASEVSDATRS